MKIRTRIIVAYLVIVALGFYYLVRKLNENVKPRYMESVESPLVDTAEVLAALLAADMRDEKIDPARFRNAFDAAAKRELAAQIYNVKKVAVDLRVYAGAPHGFDALAPGTAVARRANRDIEEWLSARIARD